MKNSRWLCSLEEQNTRHIWNGSGTKPKRIPNRNRNGKPNRAKSQPNINLIEIVELLHAVACSRNVHVFKGPLSLPTFHLLFRVYSYKIVNLATGTRAETPARTLVSRETMPYTPTHLIALASFTLWHSSSASLAVDALQRALEPRCAPKHSFLDNTSARGVSKADRAAKARNGKKPRSSYANGVSFTGEEQEGDVDDELAEELREKEFLYKVRTRNCWFFFTELYRDCYMNRNL